MESLLHLPILLLIMLFLTSWCFKVPSLTVVFLFVEIPNSLRIDLFRVVFVL